MKNKFGSCALCKNTAELQESHLIAAGFYRLMREGVADNPNPVLISGGMARATSDQIKMGLLCCACEQRFNANGENYVLANCARQDGSFGLRDSLVRTTPFHQEEGFTIYDLRYLPDAGDQLLYFGASVFWRASVARWKDRDRNLRPISLGRYEEEFRRYLLGEVQFPAKAALILHISKEVVPEMTVAFPCTNRDSGFFRHKFYVPGLLFIMYVGNRMPDSAVEGSLNAQERAVACLCSFTDDSLHNAVVRNAKQAKMARGLQSSVSGLSGRGSAWLERHVRDVEVLGSNPSAPIVCVSKLGSPPEADPPLAENPAQRRPSGPSGVPEPERLRQAATIGVAAECRARWERGQRPESFLQQKFHASST